MKLDRNIVAVLLASTAIAIMLFLWVIVLIVDAAILKCGEIGFISKAILLVGSLVLLVVLYLQTLVTKQQTKLSKVALVLVALSFTAALFGFHEYGYGGPNCHIEGAD